MSLLTPDFDRAVPIYLGISASPDQLPLEIYLDEIRVDSSPRSILYEARPTLRARTDEATQRRNDIVAYILQQSAFGEVILYEAGDWMYDLSILDPHSHLE
jgi:hypothetical protein